MDNSQNESNPEQEQENTPLPDGANQQNEKKAPKPFANPMDKATNDEDDEEHQEEENPSGNRPL